MNDITNKLFNAAFGFLYIHDQIKVVTVGASRQQELRYEKAIKDLRQIVYECSGEGTTKA